MGEPNRSTKLIGSGLARTLMRTPPSAVTANKREENNEHVA